LVETHQSDVSQCPPGKAAGGVRLGSKIVRQRLLELRSDFPEFVVRRLAAEPPVERAQKVLRVIGAPRGKSLQPPTTTTAEPVRRSRTADRRRRRV
jgi:hypothetical protein